MGGVTQGGAALALGYYLSPLQGWGVVGGAHPTVMAYDEKLAGRIRDVLADLSGTYEKKMFGGLAFLLRGNMCCGVIGAELMARVGPDAYEKALAEPHVREMDFTGRPMKGFVYVACEGIYYSADLESWVHRCVDFAGSLPAK